jgi:ABC-type enterochelin transport system permease subunit
LQYVSRNSIASPYTLGGLPAAFSSYLILKLFKAESDIYEILLSLGITIVAVSIFLVIDLKIKSSSKIIIALVISIFISTILIDKKLYYIEKFR